MISDRPARSLRAQVTLWLAAAAGSTAIAGGLAAMLPGEGAAAKVALGLLGGAVVGVAVASYQIARLLKPLYQLRQVCRMVASGSTEIRITPDSPTRDLHQLQAALDGMLRHLAAARVQAEGDHAALADRSATLARLLEFSQQIQGAGKPDAVFAALARGLRDELSLSGAVIVGVDPAETPSTRLRALIGIDPAPAKSIDLSAADCPCLRQNLPRCFPTSDSPIRCGIDALPGLPPGPAYCIPFAVRNVACLAHMVLPPGVAWSDPKRQLAQAYVNTAHSSLISISLLEEAEKQSLTDALTGLYNRRSMESLLRREIALAERHAHALSLVMIDMDQFKQVNDAHGHAAGDHLLRAFADCVRFTLRKTDLAFRFGGDEFAIALPQTPLPMAQQVVAKLRNAFAAIDFSEAVAGLDHQPTLSIGVAERSPTQGILSLDQLLAAADSALYDAKNNDRNCVRTFAPTKAA